MSLRVVLWATGPVGRHAAAAVVDHPDLELVGCYVYDPAKVGKDVGDLCGFAPIGVTATSDRDEILALEADCVLYLAQGDADPAGALDNICALLASGKNVVSTAVTPLIYPAAMGDEIVKQLEDACEVGGSSFHATGIEPGWASEVLPLAISGLLRDVESMVVQEIIDYSTYDNSFMLFDVMGFGHAPDSTDYFAADPSLLGSVFKAPIMLVAEALGAEIEDWIFDRDVWLAPDAFDIAAGRVEAGTTAALRFGASAIIQGRRALTVEHITRLRPDAAPDWPAERGWRVTVQGTPSMLVEAKVAINGEDEADQGCLGTAMHAVHALMPVCAAEPGIRTFRDLPQIVGRHVFTALRTTPSPAEKGAPS
jgi:2,4-diaminopentanoate dehydrogenase